MISLTNERIELRDGVLRITLLALLWLLTASSVYAAESEGCFSETPLDGGPYSPLFEEILRPYFLRFPEGHDPSVPAPLILGFHGWGGSEDAFRFNATVQQELDQRGYVLVTARGKGAGAPDHRLNSWSFRGSTSGIDGQGGNICDDILTDDYSYPSCNSKGVAENTCSWTHCEGSADHDVRFATWLANGVAQHVCIDTDRIYAVGESNGGMFAWELGQNPHSAGTFRAIAPIIGLPHRGYLDGPPPGAEIPVILVTGSRDQTVPPGDWEDDSFTTTSDGDHFYYTGATAITRVWAEAHGCSTDTPAQTFNTGASEADCRTYCDTEADWPPVLDCRADMGHQSGLSWSWPLILDFFDAQAASESEVEPAVEPNLHHSGAWFDPRTAGQGFFLDVLPDTGVIFLSWFTFETERPPEEVIADLGDAGHRWLTAQGEIDGATMVLDVYSSEGGEFNSGDPAPDQVQAGTMTLRFVDCENAVIEYSLDSIGQSGTINLARIAQDSVADCQAAIVINR